MITSELSRAWDDYRYGQPSPVLDAEFPFINLLAPELPAPGISFINQAIALGDPAPTVVKDGKFRYLTSHGPVLAYLVRRALYDTQFTLPVQVKRQVVQAPFVPGHVIGDDPRDMDGGPRPARVLLLGKNPGREEAQNQRNLSGPSADIVFQALRDLGIPDTEYADFYVTNLVKWPQLNPQSSTLEQAQIRDTEVLLWQELRLVKPDFILCLGSDASKYLLGTGCGVNSMAGRVESLQIPDYVAGQEPTYHTAKVMAVTNPAAVFRSPEVYPEFRLHLSEFFSLVRGEDIGRKRGKTDYRCVYTQEELRRIVDEIRNDPDPARRIIAIDGEWHGNHPSDANAYLRTIQFSSKTGEGICVVLRYQGGSPAFRPTVASAIDELKRLCCKDVAAGWLPRVGGHFLRADLPWLIQEGLDARDAYAPAESPEACRTDGGWDTSLVHHAVNEVGGFRLTDLVLRLTRLPVYDTGLKAAIIDYCKQTGLDREDLEGFGFLPAWVLHPTDTDPEREEAYAQMDADATRQIFMEHIKPGGLLDRDMYGNSSWEPYWRSHKASLGVLEMEMTGLVVDRERVDALSTLFEQARDSLLADLRQKINWPTFNAKSYQQCVAWIFGDSYLGKTWLPEDVDCLELEPIVTTGKPSKVWADVIVKGEQAKYSPSVAKEVLGILGHQHPLVMQLRDIKFLEQVLKRNTLPPPIKDKNGKYKQREDGSKIYKNGLGSVAARDGRVHTRLSQVKETGRAASSDPNLQAISKRREADYSRILGHWGTNKETGEKEYAGSYPDVFPSPLYQMPIRTVLRASPGCVLIETDYTGAELAMIAWLSRDPLMIEHVRRNALRDNDPDYYEMHSQMAVRAFQLRCEPTKRGLEDAGVVHLRVAAKNVAFGIPYGRQAAAIARQCREEGVNVDTEQCQQIIDFYFSQYPRVGDFLQECRHGAVEVGWICGPFGRFRRFYSSDDRSVVGEQERQAQNFPIQNGVADAVWQAVANFYEFRSLCPSIVYRLVLQIHDALLFEVPYAHVVPFVQHVLPACMIDGVPVYPRKVNGSAITVDSPHYFATETDIMINWGEKLKAAALTALGICPEKLAESRANVAGL